MFSIVSFIIHFVVAVITFFSFMPDTSTKNRSEYQIAQNRKYAELFNRNFPFLSVYSFILLFGPFIYYIIYFWLSRIDFCDQPLGPKAIINIIVCTLAIMFLLVIRVNKEYQERDWAMKQRKPFIAIEILLFLYTTSAICGTTLVHFGNYALDFFSTGEKHVVTITKSEHYTTRGSKGGTTHHYVIRFGPSVGGHERLEVPSSLQSRAKENDKLTLYVKNGFFGIPYISSKKILN